MVITRGQNKILPVLSAHIAHLGPSNQDSSRLNSVPFLIPLTTTTYCHVLTGLNWLETNKGYLHGEDRPKSIHLHTESQHHHHDWGRGGRKEMSLIIGLH